jgi:large subunit ribosomal protein L13
MKTFSAKPAEVTRSWLLVDLTEKNLGRTASMIARILRGKHKPEYTPHVDTGDYVVVTNAEKVAVTGKKMNDKIYYHHTGYPGGIKQTNLADLLAKHPERAIINAVRGMLPKNSLGRLMLTKLKVYAGPEHPHTAQQPQPLPAQLEVV